VPKSDQAVDGLDRIQRILAGAVRILLRLQVGFEDGFKYQHRRRLNNPIAYRRHAPGKLHSSPNGLWDRRKSFTRFILCAVSDSLF
jgi:hypothetical protein